MKGTAARGLWFEQDLEHARRLRESDKERAENVMIVDMVRNDLGTRGASGQRAGDEPVRRRALSDRPAVDVDRGRRDGCVARRCDARAVSGGVHHRRAESADDGDYRRRRSVRRDVSIPASIGFIEPGGRSQFNVAIRTVLVESRDGRGRVRRRRRNRRRFESR